MLTILAALVTPSPAEAAVYIWRADANGVWTDASNWDRVGGGPGFPSAPENEAHFVAAYTTAQTITIPDGQTVAVSRIFFVTDAANVELRFLLDTGDVITRTKTLAARQRLTIKSRDRRRYAAGKRRALDGRAVGRADRVGAIDVLPGLATPLP